MNENVPIAPLRATYAVEPHVSVGRKTVRRWRAGLTTAQKVCPPAGAGGRATSSMRPGASCRWLVGDQSVARELHACLLEREVRRGQDHVGLFELVLAERRAVGADELEQLREDFLE